MPQRPLSRTAAAAIAALAAAAVVSSACHAGQPAASVQILAINDFHGALEPPTGAAGSIMGMPAGGVEYLAAHIARAAAANPHSIVVAAGDLIGAAPPVSSLLHEEPSIEAMNAAHVALSSVGNHEFDKGAEELLRMQRGGCHPVDGCAGGQPYTGAAFQYLAANVVRNAAGGPETLFPATAVRTIDGVKIGFIGLVTTSTPQIVRLGGVQGLSFLDEADTANRYAADLVRQGVRAIVVLVHSGGHQTGRDAADPDGCHAFEGDGGFSAMLDRLSPLIRVVISGHTHQAYNCRIGGRLVTSAASNGRVLTRIALTIDRGSDAILEAAARNEVVTRDVAPDRGEADVLARYAPLVAARANRVVGAVTQPVVRRPAASGESPLGDLIADAELEAVNAAGGRADIALMNPGGIRSDITGEHPDGRVPRGQITFGDLATCQPFGNMVQVVEMSGDALRQILEQQFHADGSRVVLQVSGGFSYTYRADAAAGAHVIATSMALHGQPVRPDARLRVAAIDFLMDGGDGFTNFREHTGRQAYVSDLDAFTQYVSVHSPISPGPGNRVSMAE
jgi:5'-nucleotidase